MVVGWNRSHCLRRCDVLLTLIVPAERLYGLSKRSSSIRNSRSYEDVLELSVNGVLRETVLGAHSAKALGVELCNSGMRRCLDGNFVQDVEFDGES